MVGLNLGPVATTAVAPLRGLGTYSAHIHTHPSSSSRTRRGKETKHFWYNTSAQKKGAPTHKSSFK